MYKVKLIIIGMSSRRVCSFFLICSLCLDLLLDDNDVIKFVDFGAAKAIEQNHRSIAPQTSVKTNNLVGTPMYMSPESITGSDKGPLGRQDIWSLGCCILELVTGKRPWHHLDNEWAIMYHIVSGAPQLPDPSQASNEAISFINLCLQRNPNERPSAEVLLQHPWLSGIPEWKIDPRTLRDHQQSSRQLSIPLL